MNKLIIFILLLKMSLFAKVVSQSEQNSILVEAALFVGVFGAMGIISYIYSSKHAKEYKPKKSEIKKSPYDARVAELLEMHKNNLLSKKEFELLSDFYLN